MKTPTPTMIDVDSAVRGFTAFRDCDCGTGHRGVLYRAVMEATGPGAVAVALAAMYREGMWCTFDNEDEPGLHRHCFATLDLVNDQDEVLSDLCIPTPEAWEWWSRGIELRAISSDCPTCEPVAYAAVRRRV